MVEREAMLVAVVLVAVLAVEGKIGPLPAQSAGCIYGILFLFEKTGEKIPDPACNSHKVYV
jgi:hypothetical protein